MLRAFRTDLRLLGRSFGTGVTRAPAWGLVLGLVAVVAWLTGGSAWWLTAGLGALALAGILALPEGSAGASLQTLAATFAAPDSTPGALPPLWRQMLEAITDVGIILDQRQQVIAANTAALAMVPAMAGRHIAQVMRAPELLAAVDQARTTGKSQSFDFRTIVPVERHLTGTVTPLHSDDPAVIGPALFVLLHDRTDLEMLAQMRADFVANASHELRTPLAALKGFVETLQGAAKDDPAARDRFLSIMQGEAARMSRLIDDLLSLSRIEMHEHIAPTGIVDFAAIVANAVASLRPLAATAEVTLQPSIPPDGVMVQGDRDELMQIAQNLIQNAIKYGRAGGFARIEFQVDRERAVLSVVDNGIGIAPEHLPRLTERFYRVSAKNSRERGGTGLGLAIIKHIVNRHRGELRIASELGKGSTFTVLIPTAKPAR
jgi:two-component system phosphate regulon sensor histidine kinase PhoR